jgi:hypothetical protein
MVDCQSFESLLLVLFFFVLDFLFISLSPTSLNPHTGSALLMLRLRVLTLDSAEVDVTLTTCAFMALLLKSVLSQQKSALTRAVLRMWPACPLAPPLASCPPTNLHVIEQSAKKLDWQNQTKARKKRCNTSTLIE